MATDGWRRIESLFHHALGLSAEERSAFLSRFAPEDHALRREVADLVQSFEDEAQFLNEPVFDLGIKVLQTRDTDLPPNEIIGSYKIIRKIGSGGAGDVYLAEDVRLARRVALKFLSNLMFSDKSLKRLLVREAQAAALLEHPNICVIYSVEEVGELHFIVMQYVEGETLHDFIKRERPTVERFLAIAKQIVYAVSAAHAHGVIHRDLKPGNVMLAPNGQVKVLDFGLAKIVEQHLRGEKLSADLIENFDENHDSHQPQKLICGTVAYMSPEQLRADKLDYNSDIFSVGIVLYELLTGVNPFCRDTQTETITAILNFQPPLKQTVPDVPEAVSAIIARCLDKDLEKRFYSAVELLVELEKAADNLNLDAKVSARKSYRLMQRHAPLVFLFLTALVAFYLYFDFGRKAPVLAVLPFENETRQADKEYLTEGLTESLINRISGLSKMRVKAQPIVERYKGLAANPQLVGGELQADFVLTGKLVERENALTLHATLIETAGGTQLWTDEYVVAESELLPVQEKLLAQIVEQIEPELNETEKTLLAKRQTNSAEAYRWYLLGNHYLSRRDEKANITRAIEYFTKATDLDPLYARAWAGRADSYMLLASPVYGELSGKESIQLARAAAKKAVAYDSELCEPYVSLGIIKLRYDWDWAGAENDFKTAIRLNQDSAPAHFWYSNLLILTNRFDEAISEAGKAKELDPFSLFSEINISRLHYYARNYEQTKHAYLDLHQKNPDNQTVQYMLGFLYLQTGETNRAVEIFEKLYAIDKRAAAAGLGCAYGKAKRPREALRVLAELNELSAHSYVPPQEKALIYLGINDRERAFEFLEKACAERYFALPFLTIDPLLDELRSDARFEKLNGCVNLQNDFLPASAKDSASVSHIKKF